MAVLQVSGYKKIKVMLEKDLDIYDIWQSPNGNLFIKISDDYSIGIGIKGHHEPNEEWGEKSNKK